MNCNTFLRFRRISRRFEVIQGYVESLKSFKVCELIWYVMRTLIDTPENIFHVNTCFRDTRSCCYFIQNFENVFFLFHIDSVTTKTIKPSVVKDAREKHFFSIIIVTVKNQEHQIHSPWYKNFAL